MPRLPWGLLPISLTHRRLKMAAKEQEGVTYKVAIAGTSQFAKPGGSDKEVYPVKGGKVTLPAGEDWVTDLVKAGVLVADI
jgi:hypothetical protein